MKRNTIFALLVTSIIIAGTSAAIWLGNMQMNITVTGGVIGGSAPDMIICDKTTTMTAGTGGNSACEYMTQNGAGTMSLELTDDFVSTDPACELSPSDVVYSIEMYEGNPGNKIAIESGGPPLVVDTVDGLNTIRLWFQIDPAACPTNEATIVLSGTEQPGGL